MDSELEELLTAWLSGEISGARQEALLERLANDAEFRAAFVREIRLLGMLKAVQSTEPRWSRLEEELRDASEETETDAAQKMELRVLGAIREWPVVRRRWERMALAGACMVLTLAVVLLRYPALNPLKPHLAANPPLAVAVGFEDVKWDRQQETSVRQGKPISAGSLFLHSGRITLLFLNGVVMKIEGPAKIELSSMDRIICNEGKLRVNVPHSVLVKDFTISAPGAAVVDLGTEFGFNVQSNGGVRCMVFQGAAEMSVLAANGTTVRSEILRENSAAEIVSGATEIHDLAPQPGEFLGPIELPLPALNLPEAYSRSVNGSRPWGYWRFESAEGGRVPNEIPGRPSLLLRGQVNLVEESGHNHSARFQALDNTQSLEMDSLWTPSSSGEFAVEFLFASEQYKDCAMAALVDKDDLHHMIVELTSREPGHLLHPPGTLRFLVRDPTTSPGVNLFSSEILYPCRWHHVVAQRVGSNVELFVDGVLAGEAACKSTPAVGPCRFLLGRLREMPVPPEDTRTFAGHLDEVALYDHPLTTSEIKRHSELARVGMAEVR